MSSRSSSSQRIEALDYLRGFFIVVVIIDHLERWPSFLTIFTGNGLLWSNASDGFVITAGLLVGYIRGYKSRHKPFKDIALKLAIRSFWLYVWSVLATVILFLLAVPLPSPANMPVYDFANLDFAELVKDAVLLEYIHPWVYFLHLYTIYLLLSIVAIWLLRKNLWWVLALSIAISFFYPGESPWIERLPIFFIPVLIGWYLEPIRDFITSLGRPKLRALQASILGLFGTTLVASIALVFFPSVYPESVATFLTSLFSREPINAATVTIAALWYVGLFIVFHHALPLLKKYLAWLLLPFSTGSFSAYTVHGVPLLALMAFTPWPDNIVVNTLAGIVALLATLAIIRLPLIKRIIPQ